MRLGLCTTSKHGAVIIVAPCCRPTDFPRGLGGLAGLPNMGSTRGMVRRLNVVPQTLNPWRRIRYRRLIELDISVPTLLWFYRHTMFCSRQEERWHDGFQGRDLNHGVSSTRRISL